MLIKDIAIKDVRALADVTELPPLSLPRLKVC